MNPITCSELISVFDRIGGKLCINYENQTCMYDDHICVNIEIEEWDEIDDLLYDYKLNYHNIATEIYNINNREQTKMHRYQNVHLTQLILYARRDVNGRIL